MNMIVHYNSILSENSKDTISVPYTSILSEDSKDNKNGTENRSYLKNTRLCVD